MINFEWLLVAGLSGRVGLSHREYQVEFLRQIYRLQNQKRKVNRYYVVSDLGAFYYWKSGVWVNFQLNYLLPEEQR
jgi:hypothetical protein